MTGGGQERKGFGKGVKLVQWHIGYARGTGHHEETYHLLRWGEGRCYKELGSKGGVCLFYREKLGHDV